METATDKQASVVPFNTGGAIDMTDAQRAALADPLTKLINRAVNSQAVGDLGRAAVAGLGLGVGGRSLLGLIRTLSKPAPKDTRRGPSELALPIPIKAGGSWYDALKDFAGGGSATAKAGIPWYPAGVALTGMGAVGAGWKGMDLLLDKQREQARQAELEKARSEFHDALLSQYDAPVSLAPTHKPRAKAAADDDGGVGAGLDRIYDRMVKLGIFGFGSEDTANAGGALLGGYNLYASLSGLGAGALAYEAARKRSRAAVIEKALKARAARKFQLSPPEIYARPEPLELPGEDEEKEASDSVARHVAALARR